MRVLLLGAAGFLGRHICAQLLRNGFSVVAAVRDVKSAERRFPGIEAVRLDGVVAVFYLMTAKPALW